MATEVPVHPVGASGERDVRAPARAYEWVSGHVYYHGDLDLLVSALIAELVEELTRNGLIERYFFLRYWEGGQHLRVRLLPTSSRQRLDTMALFKERAERFLGTFPSADSPDSWSYPELADGWAAAEGRAEYDRRLYPNNSLRFLPYVREHDRYGDGRSMAAVERHFDESSRLAIRLLDDGIFNGHRETFGLMAVLTAWFRCEPDPFTLRRYLSRRGDAGWRAEAGGPALDESGPSGTDHEAAYQRQAGRLATLIERARLLARSVDIGGDQPLAAWVRTIDRLRATLLDLSDVTVRTSGSGTSRGPGRPARSGPARSSTGPILPRPARILRLVDLCAHQFCNRIGIPVTVEQQLRQLAVRAVMDVPRESTPEYRDEEIRKPRPEADGAAIVPHVQP